MNDMILILNYSDEFAIEAGPGGFAVSRCFAKSSAA